MFFEFYLYKFFFYLIQKKIYLNIFIYNFLEKHILIKSCKLSKFLENFLEK